MSYEGTGKLKYLSQSKKIDPLILFSGFDMPGMSEIPCTLIGTDGGKTWLVWASCFELGGNATTMWSIMSRTPTMDSKLEQTLVEFVEKNAGIPGAQLRGVGQTNCHGADN